MYLQFDGVQRETHLAVRCADLRQALGPSRDVWPRHEQSVPHDRGAERTRVPAHAADTGEFTRFVACCAGAGKIGVLFVTAFASGTRQGELLAVQWRYADLDRGVLWILQDLERPRGGGFRYGDVKTGHAKRLVRLRRGLCEA